MTDRITARRRTSLGRRAGCLGGALLMVAGCTGATATLPPSPTVVATASFVIPSAVAAPGGPSASPAPSIAAVAPTSVCADRLPPFWVTKASHPKDGVPDPTGRIYFGLIERYDDALGQIIAPLFAIDPDGSDLVQVLDCQIARPRVSPDGNRLAFSMVMSDGTWQVATSTFDGNDVRILTDTAGWAEFPDWSPDGSWLAYDASPFPCTSADCVDADGFRETIWRMDADGSDQRLLGDPDTFDAESRISPDGREVVFDRWDPAQQLQAFMIRDLATGAERRVTTTNHGDITHPDWTRDGRSIVYNTNIESIGEVIQTVPANDPSATPTTLYGDAGHPGFKAAYSPDGERIVFGCDGNLCLMDADGSNVVVLMDVSGEEINHPAWGVQATSD